MSNVDIPLKYKVAQRHGLKDEDLVIYDRLVELSHDETSIREFTRLLDQTPQKALDAFNDYRGVLHGKQLREG